MGIAASSGRYILPLDADNLLRPRYPAVAAAVLDRDPDIAVVYNDSQLFGEQHRFAGPAPFDLDRLLRGNYIDNCAVYRRESGKPAGVSLRRRRRSVGGLGFLAQRRGRVPLPLHPGGAFDHRFVRTRSTAT
jgi:hypothetical protein